MWPGGRDEGLAWKSNSTFAQIRSQKEDQKLTEFEPAGVVARLTHQHLLQVEGGGDAEQIFTNIQIMESIELYHKISTQS